MRSALACAALALLAAWPSVAQDISVRETHAWDQTLSRIAPAVVTIEIDQTRAFDTEWNQSSQATGFVVDAERGSDTHQPSRRHPGSGDRDGRVPESRGSRAAARVSRPGARLRVLSLRPGETALTPRRLPCRCIRKARASAPRSASSATTRVSSSPSWRARSRGSIARRPSTASASTTTSIPSTSRRRPAPRAGPRARR